MFNLSGQQDLATFYLEQLLTTATPQVFVTIGIILTAGSMIVTWLGEQITDKDTENIGFYDHLCRYCRSILRWLKESMLTTSSIFQVAVWLHLLSLSLFWLMLSLLIVYFTTFVQQAEYKIQSNIQKLLKEPPSSFIPSIEGKPSGGYPSYLASSITAPAAILQFWVLQVMIGLGYGTRNVIYNISNRCCHKMPCWSFSLHSSIHLYRSINSRESFAETKEWAYSWCPSW